MAFQPRKLFKRFMPFRGMFNKKKCGHCGEKISGEFNFCPFCRSSLKTSSDSEDWGLLGKNDSFEDVKMPVGINTLLNSLLKGLNQQMNELDNSTKKQTKKTEVKKGGISISISTSGNRPPEIKVSSFGNMNNAGKENQVQRKVRRVKLPSSDVSKFIGLPKEEPETSIKRMSNTVIYEINLPGVKSTDDISIMQLENSIEIKALSKDKVFQKIIAINLPIRSYNLSKGKLVLELDTHE